MAQENRTVITSRGRSVAALNGVGGKDRETVILEADPTFWRMVQIRRAQSRLTLEELNARLKRRLILRHKMGMAPHVALSRRAQ